LDEKETEKSLITFFEKLPEVQQRLYDDATALLENDPAAKSLEEVILTYPGFFALLVYRIAHELYLLNIPIIPRLFSEYAHVKTGIDIHPGATIGNHFFLDHGTGTVIGETCIIGNNVKIYQGVTLGALCINKNDANIKRHPTVEDNVIIYACATILGADTVIGHDSIIGGNVWLTQSIPAYTTVYYTPEMKIKPNDIKRIT
jgi:serine O-acetyltransferase